MKILTIDIGTGTQDIFLFDSHCEIENGYKLIMPSPTMMVRQQVTAATLAKRDIALEGVIMGGGPSGWAVKNHIAQGLKVYATCEAAKSFDDDLNKIAEMGISLVSEDEIKRLSPEILHIEMRDVDFHKIEKAFALYGVSLSDLDAVAIAVFDHGNAPVDQSDRKFRFNYLDQRIREVNSLSGFAYTAENIPEIMTRMRAVADSLQETSLPLVVMDTSPAAVLGATYDPVFPKRDRMMLANAGNGHTLVFRLGPSGIEGVMEHHTEALTKTTFDEYIAQFAAGTLTDDRVFTDNGHGCLVYTQDPYPMDHPDFNLLVTGPRRNKFKDSRYKPRFAVPFGDMMLTGCFGLLSAVADLLPDYSDEILASLASGNIENMN